MTSNQDIAAWEALTPEEQDALENMGADEVSILEDREHDIVDVLHGLKVPYGGRKNGFILLDANSAHAIQCALTAAGFGRAWKPEYGPEMQRPEYVRNKQAEALG